GAVPVQHRLQASGRPRCFSPGFALDRIEEPARCKTESSESMVVAFAGTRVFPVERIAVARRPKHVDFDTARRQAGHVQHLTWTKVEWLLAAQLLENLDGIGGKLRRSSSPLCAVETQYVVEDFQRTRRFRIARAGLRVLARAEQGRLEIF